MSKTTNEIVRIRFLRRHNRKFYAYNLGLTGDRANVEAERAPDSPLQALRPGQSAKIDPAEVQAALAVASMHRRPAPTPAQAAGAPASPKELRYMFRIVIAFSAGTIAAATLAIR